MVGVRICGSMLTVLRFDIFPRYQEQIKLQCAWCLRFGKSFKDEYFIKKENKLFLKKDEQCITMKKHLSQVSLYWFQQSNKIPYGQSGGLKSVLNFLEF